MRRRLPWWVLALLFMTVPVIEITLIVQLGQVIGPWWTVLALVASGILGAVLVRREGSRAWGALVEALRAGKVPSRELADGALILVGGALLLTPGFLTDIVGLICVLPVTRAFPRVMLRQVIARRLVIATTGGPPGPSGSPRSGRDDAPPDPGVVRGDVIEDRLRDRDRSRWSRTRRRYAPARPRLSPA